MKLLLKYSLLQIHTYLMNACSDNAKVHRFCTDKKLTNASAFIHIKYNN
jgi:hypothetical protein